MNLEILHKDELGLTFVTEVKELDSRKVMELCSGNSDLVVSIKNRHQHGELMIQCHFVITVAEDC